MRVENKLGILGRVALAASMATAVAGPTSASHDEPLNLDPASVNYEYEMEKRKAHQEREDKKFELVLDAIPEFIDLNSNETIAEFYRRIKEKPGDYIEVLDPLTAKTFNMYDGSHWVYLIYGQDKTNLSDINDWSIQVIALDNGEMEFPVTVGVKLEPNFDIYDISSSNSSNIVMDAINLGSHSNEIFNIPEGMKAEEWDYEDNGVIEWFEKRYIDPNNPNSEYVQFLIQPSNVISLQAQYPISVTHVQYAPPYVIGHQQQSQE